MILTVRKLKVIDENVQQIDLTSHSIPLKKNVGINFPPILMQSINPLAFYAVLDEACGHYYSPPIYLDFDRWHLKLLVHHMISTLYIKPLAIMDDIITNFHLGYQTISNSSASTMWMYTSTETYFSHGKVEPTAKKSFNEFAKKDTKTPLFLNKKTTKQYDHGREQNQKIVSKGQEMEIKKQNTSPFKIRKKRNKKNTSNLLLFAIVKVIFFLCLDFANGLNIHEEYSTTKKISLKNKKKTFHKNKEIFFSSSRKIAAKIMTEKTKNGSVCIRNKQCKSERCRYLLKDEKSEGKICLPKIKNLVENNFDCKRDWECKSKQCLDGVCRSRALLTVGSLCNKRKDCLTKRCMSRFRKNKTKGKICFPKKKDLLGDGSVCRKPWECRSTRCIKKVCKPKNIQPNPPVTSDQSSNPSTNPSSKPSSNPSLNPSTNLSSNPSTNPSAKPSSDPSLTPSTNPSAKPSSDPSSNPSTNPSSKPSSGPSLTPSTNPSANPSTNPSSKPSTNPSSNPSTYPSSKPSTYPSSKPSTNPSSKPSTNPSSNPSTNPSSKPSTNPSSKPSTYPSSKPSTNPSSMPSTFPSSSPSTNVVLED